MDYKMPDKDSNGVDVLDRFLAYKSRFMQFSVTEDVFNQVVEHIKELRRERDEARRIACLQSCMGDDEPREWSPEDFANQQGWDCFKKDSK
jgi:hypothetical protein